MTSVSPFQTRSETDCASERGAQPHKGSTLAPIVVVRLQFQTAPRDLLPAQSRGRCWPSSSGIGRFFAGQPNRLLPRVTRSKPISAPLGSSRQGRAGFLNSLGLLKAARCFVGTLRQFFQEPRSVLFVLFSPSPLCVVAAHEQQQNTKGCDACAEKLSLRSVK